MPRSKTCSRISALCAERRRTHEARIHEKSTDALVFDSGRLLTASTALAQTAEGPASGVTAADIAAGFADPTRWLTFSGDYTGQRHSPLRQITPRNVRSARPAVDVPVRHLRARPRLRDDAARARRRAVRDGRERLRVGHRCAHGPAVLGVSAHVAERSHVRRQRAREPRLRHPRRAAVHGDAGRALARARSALRRRALGRRARRLSHRLRGDARAARRRRQSHRRHLGRRIPDARLRRCLRSRDRRAHLAALHGPRTRRARQRDLAERRRAPRAAAAARG